MKEWSEKSETSAEVRLFELPEKGVKMKRWKFRREKLHER